LLERLVDEQRLVAGDEVHLRETARELALELATGDFQAGPSSCASAMAWSSSRIGTPSRIG